MHLQELLKEQYVDSIPRKDTAVGMEIELPIVPFEGGVIPRSLIEEFLPFAQSLGFRPVRFANDGTVCELADEEGTTLSFETSWNTLEFSLKCERDLLALRRKYVNALVPVQEFFMERGYFLCGRGVNPNYEAMDPAALDTDILQAKSRYLAEYTQHHDGEIFHALCSSVQTHLDAPDKAQYLRLFSLMRRAYVFEALFFANSLPVKESFLSRHPALKLLARDTLCYRDELWKYCGAPNTVLDETPIRTVDDFMAYLNRLKLFIAVENGKFRPMAPTALKDYCHDPDWIPEMLTCYRSLEPVAPTKWGTMEIRSTCVQPLDAMLEPVAFYTGLAAVPDKAERLVDDIFSRFFPGQKVVEVRDALMRASNTELRQTLQESGKALLLLAISGLESRGYGEERLLLPLLERLEENGWTVPALCMWDDALAQTNNQMCSLGKEIH